jgi:hypothetical protein
MFEASFGDVEAGPALERSRAGIQEAFADHVPNHTSHLKVIYVAQGIHVLAVCVGGSQFVLPHNPIFNLRYIAFLHIPEELLDVFPHGGAVEFQALKAHGMTSLGRSDGALYLE